MGKLKYSLISLLAVCLTAGGVFAAWTFSDANYNSSEDVDIGVNSGLLPADRYESTVTTFISLAAQLYFGKYAYFKSPFPEL